MLPEYYWFSLESARQSCQHYANPNRKTWIRFKPLPEGGFSAIEREWVPPPRHDVPGYYTLMCAETGQIFNYTERLKTSDARPQFRDATFVGQFHFYRTIMLRHKDGTPGHYNIGYGGLGEQELTPDLAQYIIKACQACKAPTPIIKTPEEFGFLPASATAVIQNYKSRNNFE